jgi:hypothetical protein
MLEASIREVSTSLRERLKDEAIALLKQALRGDEAAREQAMLPLCLIFLGEAHVLGGQLDDALPLAR